jgi:hypothetical protein
VASLDVLDYTTRLDRALAAHTRSAGLRRAALREARRLIDAMAFRFAILDERPLPEDLDYLRALEAMKPPEAAAAVLARRLPAYARARRQRLVFTWTVLVVVGLLAGGLVYLATSERATELAAIHQSAAVNVQYTAERDFNVTSQMTRLHVDGSVFLGRDANGTVLVSLVDPTGQAQMSQSFSPNGDNYLRYNVVSPMPGPWRLLVDFDQADGSVDVTVDGITPTR